MELDVPMEWVDKCQEDRDGKYEIHFVWNTNSEAAIFNPKTGKLLQGIAEDSREVYQIRCKNKDDTMDSDLVK